MVRPMHFRWTGDLPQSWPEMEDLKTKVAFNGAYVGERDQIYLINKMIKTGPLRNSEKYHPIELIEIEQSKPRGFFGYIFEDMDVFESAARDARKHLLDNEGNRFRRGPARARQALALQRERDAEWIRMPGIPDDSV